MSLIIDLFNGLFTYPIFNALMAIYHVLGDFGLAIVILTGIVYLLILPFSLRLWKDAKARRALQPRIEEIKRQQQDLGKQAEAQRQLYKEHGVGLFPPIVPMLLQYMVLMGVFFALNVVLRNGTLGALNALIYPFLPHFQAMPNLNLQWFTIFNPGWFIALGQPDPTHVLPILTGILTFVQMRMAQPVTEAREVIMQGAHLMQLLMLFLMVGVTIFFAWQFAAGVALYRLVSLLLSALQQYFTGGWGSLWVMPHFALAGVTGGAETEAPRRKRRGGGPGHRRRNRRPRRR
jgi:YidC/Oxa1 family membrane protein insertase